MQGNMGGWMANKATVTEFPPPSTGSQRYTAGNRQNCAIVVCCVCMCPDF